MKPTILVIEDSQEWHYTINRLFGDKAELLFAATVADAGRIFTERSGSLAGIVVDGCLNTDDRFDTGPLVEYLRRHFAGPIVAASSVYNSQLMAAGCTHRADMKDDSVRVVLDAVGSTETG